jgi:predicted nucleotidyltransferase
MTIEKNREEILRIAARYGARNVRVFGSVAQGEDRFDSDVDLLVEMETTDHSWISWALNRSSRGFSNAGLTF